MAFSFKNVDKPTTIKFGNIELSGSFVDGLSFFGSVLNGSA